MGFDQFRDYGTVMGVDYPGFVCGSFPVRNFRTAELEGWEKLSFLQYAQITQKHAGCYACTLHCGKIRKVPSGPYAGVTSEGPQYETLWAFTGPTGCTNLEATVYADHLCCELGLDSISTGNSIGFAYELFEKGILTVKDTDGLVLNYGDHEPMIELIGKIGRREGLGDILAEGVKRAAEHIGKGSEQYAMHPHPRVVDAAADDDKGDIVKYNHDTVAAFELANCCHFPAMHLEFFDLDLMGKMLVAALGVPRFGNADYLTYVGEKVYNLERCFNIREGFTRKDDTLPKRMFTEPLKGGMRDGEVIRKPDTIIDEYYDASGWDRNGIPTGETLARLGLEKLDRDIARFRR